MRTLKIAAALFLGLWLIPASIFASPNPQAKQTALHQVNKLYLEELGTSAEAARFRLLLADKLAEKGFTVVDKPEQADAVLSGALSVSPPGLYGGASDVGVTVQLKSAAGERLWSGNFAGQIIILGPVASFKFKDAVEYRAKELAKRLRSDWEKSAKVAGVKVNN